MKHFIDLAEWSSRDLQHIIQLAVHLKTEYQTGGNRPLMAGKTLGMILEKQSLRTRVSFEIAMQHLGGSTITLAPYEIGRLGERESVPDIARVMSGYVQAIAARVYEHHHVRELAQWSSVPVINALCNLHHPCQAMADALTMVEHFGDLKGLHLAYVGDGNNVAVSLMHVAAHFGMHFHIASPPEYALPSEKIAQIEALAVRNGARIQAHTDPQDAVRGANVIYTDTWVSMGQEKETSNRIEILQPYQLNADLMSLADGEAMAMHCLPAHRGYEITEDIADGPRALIFQQAENRLHVQKAILVKLLVAR
jgi:ornithine carbamoyltransferase